MRLHLRATEHHLPYVITQCYLPPNTGELGCLDPKPAGQYLIYLPQRDGRLSATRGWLDTDMVYLFAGSNPSSNHLTAT